MRFRKGSLLATIAITALLWWFPGCAEQTPELIGPMTEAPHSNTTVSGYMRSGAAFSGH